MDGGGRRRERRRAWARAGYGDEHGRTRLKWGVDACDCKSEKQNSGKRRLPGHAHRLRWPSCSCSPLWLFASHRGLRAAREGHAAAARQILLILNLPVGVAAERKLPVITLLCFRNLNRTPSSELDNELRFFFFISSKAPPRHLSEPPPRARNILSYQRACPVHYGSCSSLFYRSNAAKSGS